MSSAISDERSGQFDTGGSEMPSESFVKSSPEAQPKERYSLWTSLENAGLIGGLVAVPTFMGAVGNAVLGAHPLVPVGVSALSAAAVGTYSYKSAMKSFNGHPVLAGMATFMGGITAAMVTPFLSIPGAAYGWKGAAIATAVAAAGTGAVSAIGIHHANKEIDAHNATLACG